MGSRSKKLSFCPVLVKTRTDGFDQSAVEVIERSLEFRFFEGHETHHAFPHTSGWQTLPFSVFTCILDYGGTVHMRGQPDVELRPGDAYLIPAGVRHKFDAFRAEGVHAVWMHFAFRLLGGMDLFSLTKPPGLISARQAQRGRHALEVVIELHTGSAGPPLMLMARRRKAVSSFLELLLEICPPRDDINELVSGSRRLGRVLAYIHDHFAEPIRRDDLVRMTKMSRTRFHCLFRQVTGMGAMQYVKYRRLQAAQSLLLTTDAPIGEISAAVGYQDHFHFTRLFTAAVGCSPRAFRKNAGFEIKYTLPGTIH